MDLEGNCPRCIKLKFNSSLGPALFQGTSRTLMGLLGQSSQGQMRMLIAYSGRIHTVEIISARSRLTRVILGRVQSSSHLPLDVRWS